VRNRREDWEEGQANRVLPADIEISLKRGKRNRTLEGPAGGRGRKRQACGPWECFLR